MTHPNGTDDSRCPRLLDPVPEDRRDVAGFLYGEESWGTWRLTECCHAAVTYSDSTLCCKCCWDEVDAAYDAPARLAESDPVTITQPVVYRLPKGGQS